MMILWWWLYIETRLHNKYFFIIVIQLYKSICQDKHSTKSYHVYERTVRVSIRHVPTFDIITKTHENTSLCVCRVGSRAFSHRLEVLSGIIHKLNTQT